MKDAQTRFLCRKNSSLQNEETWFVDTTSLFVPFKVLGAVLKGLLED